MMREIVASILTVIFTVIITFGVVCLGVLMFAVQFGFEWSFLLCACVWIAIAALRYVFKGE